MGTPVGDDSIRQWMDEQGLRLRKIRKVKAGGQSPDRDAQFRNIAELIEQYEQDGNPCFSVDTKAKEFQGQLFRKGRVRCNQAFEAFDHDFPSWADGVIIPHGIFDLYRNRGHINVGLSRDTTEFACDSLKWYWNRIGRQSYPDADSILLLVDCGGSNSASKYIFKHDLQAVVDAIQQQTPRNLVLESTILQGTFVTRVRKGRLIDFMTQDGIAGPYYGAKPRTFLADAESWSILKVPGGEPPTGQRFSGQRARHFTRRFALRVKCVVSLHEFLLRR